MSIETKELMKMGLSASQARMLQLTARRSDIEYQMQQIAQSRLALADQMSIISRNYTEALNDQVLYFRETSDDNSKIKLTHMHVLQQGYEIYDTKAGEIVQPSFKANLSDFDFSSIDASSTLSGIIGSADKQKTMYITNEAGKKQLVTEKSLEENGYTVIGKDTNSTGKEKDLQEGLRDGTYSLADKDGKAVDYKSVTNITDESNINASLTMKNGKFYLLSQDGKTQTEVIFGNHKDADGNDLGEGYDKEKNILYLNSDKLNKTGLLSSELLDAGLREAKYQLVSKSNSSEDVDVRGQKYAIYDWRSSSFISDVPDTTNDGAATATYEGETSEAQQKDKTLELKLKNLENEHKAVETEIDSVKQVITKNIEGSFKLFTSS